MKNAFLSYATSVVVFFNCIQITSYTNGITSKIKKSFQISKKILIEIFPTLSSSINFGESQLLKQNCTTLQFFLYRDQVLSFYELFVGFILLKDKLWNAKKYIYVINQKQQL